MHACFRRNDGPLTVIACKTETFAWLHIFSGSGSSLDIDRDSVAELRALAQSILAECERIEPTVKPDELPEPPWETAAERAATQMDFSPIHTFPADGIRADDAVPKPSDFPERALGEPGEDGMNDDLIAEALDRR